MTFSFKLLQHVEIVYAQNEILSTMLLNNCNFEKARKKRKKEEKSFILNTFMLY